MYYCFVEEDFVNLCDNDPLVIQAEYAKSLGRYCCCRLAKGDIFDYNLQPLSLRHTLVLLRTTYNRMTPAMKILKACGAILLETVENVHSIEHWDSLALQKRPIFIAHAAEICSAFFSSDVEKFLLDTPRIFIKSRKKGFTVQMPSVRLLQKDTEISNFFRTHCSRSTDELLISESLLIKRDSLGLKESRHFVFDGVIANSSRALHSLKHAVPKALQEKATQIVDLILKYESFPKNFVIDIGEFERNGEVYTDIVELNPLSSSLCYVNNSIFDEVRPEIQMLKKRTGMGAEYCYDAINQPEHYSQKRYAGVCYTYVNPEHYLFH